MDGDDVAVSEKVLERLDLLDLLSGDLSMPCGERLEVRVVEDDVAVERAVEQACNCKTDVAASCRSANRHGIRSDRERRDNAPITPIVLPCSV